MTRRSLPRQSLRRHTAILFPIGLWSRARTREHEYRSIARHLSAQRIPHIDQPPVLQNLVLCQETN